MRGLTRQSEAPVGKQLQLIHAPDYGVANVKFIPLERDEIWLNRHRAIDLRLSMISAQTPLAFVAWQTATHPASSAGQAFSG